MKQTFISTLVLLGLPMMELAQSAPMVKATVKKIDETTEKITLDHGPIPNLDMDGMTMVFKAGDPAMLKQVKPGDKVQFSAERVNGQITVTRISKQ